MKKEYDTKSSFVSTSSYSNRIKSKISVIDTYVGQIFFYFIWECVRLEYFTWQYKEKYFGASWVELVGSGTIYSLVYEACTSLNTIEFNLD